MGVFSEHSVDWRMVLVVGGMSYTMYKGRGNCPGGEMSGGICPSGYVLHSLDTLSLMSLAGYMRTNCDAPRKHDELFS